MAFVQFSHVSLAFGPRQILDGVSLNLMTGSRAALAGTNGSGKTTLMRIMAGQIQPDGGERSIQKGSRISYLPQYGIVHSGSTLVEEAERAFDPVVALIRERDEVGRVLETVKEGDERTDALLEDFHRLDEAVSDSGYYDRRARIETILLGLGFSHDDMGRQTEEFSGGWQMRIALARVLLENPDIMLLDEPTNYLDIEARTWLEGYLNAWKGGFLIVSHDKYFLDVTVNEVLELFNGSIKRYPGNYSHYESVRATELESIMKKYEEQQEEIAKTEDFIRRFRYKATKAAAVQSRIKLLEKMPRIEIPESLKKIHFTFPPAPHLGRIAMTLDGVTRHYDSLVALKPTSAIFEKGERVAVVGKNGAGKSTLLRIMAGHDTGFGGAVKLGAGAEIGYYSQDTADSLDPGKTAIGELEAIASIDLVPKLRDFLGAFLFRGDDIFKSVSVLSGGERSRLALLKILLYPRNILILDEPTNHLDLTSKDVLLEALQKYDGTVFFVSHDRYFLEQLATRVFALTDGVARDYPGGYPYYLEKLEKEEALASGAAPLRRGELDLVALRSGGGKGSAGAPVAAGAAAAPAVPADTAGSAEASGIAGPRIVSLADQAAARATPPDAPRAALSRDEEKRLKTQKKRLEREEAEILETLDRLEGERKALDEALATPEVYTDGLKVKETTAKIQANEAEQARLQERWEAVAAGLEALG